MLYFIFGARLGRQLSYLLRAHMGHIGFYLSLRLRCKIYLLTIKSPIGANT